MLTKNYLKSILLLLCIIVGGVNPAWAEEKSITIGFEEDSYIDWELVTIKSKETNSGVSAYEGNYFGSTAGEGTGCVKTKEKITSPKQITFYISKATTNTTASNWIVKVSSDGATWENVGANQSASSGITKGKWTEVQRDLSSYSDVYVGIFYEGTTAVRYIDDITITYDVATSGPVDLKSFAFTENLSVTLSKSGDFYEATCDQKVIVEPDSYDGEIAYAIESSTFDEESSVIEIDNETGKLDILTSENVGGIIVVKASGTGTDAYNKPDDATYTLTVNAAPVGVGTPTFSLAAGSYYYGTKVEIEAINSTLITYTTDGTEPTFDSPTYSDFVAVKNSMTLKAKAWDDDLNESEIASVDYTLKAPEVPVSSVNEGEVLQGSTVTLTPGEGGSVIVYTTDGTDPTIDSDVYDKPIIINEAMTIKAATVDDGDNLSAIACFNFTVKKAVVYEKVTDASTLAAGDKLMIVNESASMAMSTTQNNNNRGVADVSISDNKIVNPSNLVQILELEGSNGAWYFYTGSGYIYAAGSGKNNYMRTETNKDDNAKAAISISEGEATIEFQVTNISNLVCYNPSNKIFSCYSNVSSSAKLVQLYRLQENLEDVTIKINPSETFTLNNGETKMLTVTASNGADITATSSDEEVATVEKTGDDKYTVTAVKGSAEGTDVTITFSTAKTATHKAGKATIMATVKDSRIELNLSFAEESVSVNVGESVAAPALSGNEGNGAVTYASADETIATVDASTGEVTGVADGTTTITATVAEVPGYHGGSVQFTVNVIDPNKKGTKNNPYTVTEAIDAIDNGGEVSGVYVAGIVSQVDYYNNDYKSITYWISEDGTTENQFQVYSGKGIDGADFSSVNDVLVGDVVVVYGDIKKYNSVYEFNFNNELVSLSRKAESDLTKTDDITLSMKTPDVTANATDYFTSTSTGAYTYEIDNTEVATVTEEGVVSPVAAGTATLTVSQAADDSYKKGSVQITVTVEAASKTDTDIALDEIEGTTAYGTPLEVYYLLTEGYDGELSYSVVPSEVADVVISDDVITFTPKAVGEATITLTAPSTAIFNEAVETFTLTVTGPEAKMEAPAGGTYFSESFDKCDGKGGRDGSYSNITSFKSTADKLDEVWDPIDDVAAYKCIKLGTSSNSGKVTTRAIALIGDGTLTFSAAGWGDSKKNTVKVTAEGATLSGDVDVPMSNGIWSDYTVNITEGNGEVKITFAMQRGFLDDVKVFSGVAAPEVTLAASGYATYCSEYPLDLSKLDREKARAWYVSEVNETTVTFKEITETVKGGTPFVLYGTPEAKVTLSYGNDDVVALSGNQLEGTLAPTYVASDDDFTYFGLSNGTFVKMNPGVVKANKAYLPLLTEQISAGARLNVVFDEGTTTGIDAVNSESQKKNNDVYNLNGQRVENMKKGGLYIVNGKKVVVK